MHGPSGNSTGVWIFWVLAALTTSLLTTDAWMLRTRPARSLLPLLQQREDLQDKSVPNIVEHRKIRLSKSGKLVPLRSRSLPISKDWSITVWEWEEPAEVVETYWEAQGQMLTNMNPTQAGQNNLLDPFGLVTWPGSVVAAQILRENSERVVQDRSVLVLGAGVGVEAQAVAELGAARVIATDIHPTTLQQLELGVVENEHIENKEIVETKIFDLFGQDPVPASDVIVVADVLYNEDLASQVITRLVEAWVQNPDIIILVTDSQRFVDFTTELNDKLAAVQGPTPIEWTEQKLDAFTGSGVCINEDQTYDVKVRSLWIGK